MERARARAEAKLFGRSTPARIGRYEIIDTVGGGGMGVVYRALDPQLQRKVALKVLHPLRDHGEHAQQRMLTEARALAQLDHPNVVNIYDALIDGAQVIVVMELLEGKTLEEWEKDTKPSWRDAIAVYAQAGKGLAAAHEVGVVHRDFKPSNAIICSDGRVCVVDFGLARIDDSPEIPSSGVPRPGLTETGVVLGTLGFASPEQLAGEPVTPASDQFSFCVALHRAVEGVAPFVGANQAERQADIEWSRPRLATDGRKVPAWLRALLARGLSPQVRDRRASMHELVRELERPRGWKRWRLAVSVAAVLAPAIVGTALLSRGAVEEPCDGALVEDAWNAARRAEVDHALAAVNTPYARHVRSTVVGRIDQAAAEWSTAHRSACRAHLRGDTSSLVFDRQTTCLARRLGDVRAAVSVLRDVDATTIDNVMEVVTEIPRAEPCLNLELSEVDPPSSVDVERLVAAVRARISTAEAQHRAGRSEEALALLEGTRAFAHSLPYPPVHVDLALAEGRIHIARGDLPRAIPVLAAARSQAFEQQMLPAALEAAARLIYAEGTTTPQLERLRGEADNLLPLSVGLRGDTFVRPLLLNNIGAAYLAAGDRAEAMSYLTQAKSEIERTRDESLELAGVDSNLALITSDTAAREALARGVYLKLRSRLGEQHFFTLDALYAYGLFTGDQKAAFDLLARVATAYAAFHPASLDRIARVASKLAVLAAEMGNADVAKAQYAHAIESLKTLTDPDSTVLRQLCEGELALQRKDAQTAIAALQAVYTTRIHSANWWERADALRAAVGLGQALAMGRDRSAAGYLETAVREYPSILAINEEVEFRIFLDRARRTASIVRNAD